MDDQIPPPVPAPVSERYKPHLEGLRESRLLVRQCGSCGRRQWPPRPCCEHCLSEEFSWVEVPTEAEVYTYTVCYRAFHAWFASRTPYGVVVAQVLPDIRIVGACFREVERLECGMTVRASFDPEVEGWPILCWEPDP